MHMQNIVTRPFPNNALMRRWLYHDEIDKRATLSTGGRQRRRRLSTAREKKSQLAGWAAGVWNNGAMRKMARPVTTLRNR